ncbi:molecular chaperone [filamentous cyanobacterium LEGE 11480]|uniref:Molecular chaperone n=1 Tax=Romeriopsis navalis LEGE 11480 TaxID=2777977 RepID=A0A928VLG5_9CYAN|nr:fimbria/pilus periplasmic chaperone [Romeriopsis navalis]MBE9029817.1 molecular chaperone [Romeriopsis navalis LEGE 11480]
MQRFPFMRLAIGLLLGSGLILGSGSHAQAFRLKPISRVFRPTGTESTQSYEIHNTTKALLAVEVNTAKRSMNLQGKETLTPADDDFMIYPPQILLKPGESQTVRVTWLGNPKPEQELAYRLIAAQLPINLEPKKIQATGTQVSAGVKLAMRYEGSLYIRPFQAKADVVVEKMEAKMQGAKRMLAVTLHNRGTSRAILLDSQLELNGGIPAKVFTANEMNVIKQPVLLVNHKRQILVPYPVGATEGSFTGKLRLDDKRQ